jgi:hypothetical protein
MNQKTSITERALLYQIECPLRSDGTSLGPEVPVLECAESAYRWLMSEIVAGRQPTAGGTREYFEAQWQMTKLFQTRDAIPAKRYQRLVMQGVRACARLRDLLWTHEILQPLARYELLVDGVAITGEYAVLLSSRRNNEAFIPYLRHEGVKLRPVIPDVVTYARWLDAAQRLPLRQRPGRRISVMHYWVSQYLAALHQPDAGFAGQALRGAAAAITGPPYPIAGEHCLACPTRNCRTAVCQEHIA